MRGDEEASLSLRLIGRQYVDIRKDEEAGLNSVSASLLLYLKELDAQEQKAKKEASRLAAQKTDENAWGVSNPANISSPKETQAKSPALHTTHEKEELSRETTYKAMKDFAAARGTTAMSMRILRIVSAIPQTIPSTTLVFAASAKISMLKQSHFSL